MRLRRVTAITVAAAAVGLTLTAAVSPSPPADPPVSLPALTPQGLSARYAASVRAIDRAARAAARSGDPGQARTLEALDHQHLLAFDARGQGEAVEVLGNLSSARRVAILVPGSDTSLATFASRGTVSPDGGARALAAQARRLDPGRRLAVIAWLGYRTPSLLSPAVLTSGNAGQGAQALRPLVTSLAQHGDQVALLCHSYGSVVCGLAAPHLPVTDIAVYGSPGMDAASVRSLHTSARVWAGREAGDWIRNVPHVRLLGMGFGADPTSPSFGARRFACGRDGHSSYLQPGSLSLRNLAYIALGEPGKVTR
jgi:hypothetical protein